MRKNPFYPPPSHRVILRVLKRALFNKKGIGLMETLMVSALGLTISYGVFKVNEVSMYTAKVVNSNLDQKDLRGTIYKTLGNKEACVHNLKKPASSSPKTSITSLQAKSGANWINLINSQANQNLFKNSLRIQKFEFKNSKDFSIYYSKEGLGRHETLVKSDGTKGVCTNTNTADCYSLECKVDFSCSNNNCDGSGDRCSLLDCTGGAEGGGGANCYMVETDGNTKTLIGCGGTDKAEGKKTTALGFGAGKINRGDNNTFLGAYTGAKNTAGDRNVFVGEVAGFSNTRGAHNVFIGVASGNKNTTGQENTFIGRGSGFKNETASNNTFLGAWSGFENKTGIDNTFIGVSAGNKNNSNFNTFVGKNAGFNNRGPGNTFIGERAGESNTDGGQNTFIGAGAGLTNTTGNDNIAIGRHVYLDSATGNHQINIGKIIKAGSGFLQICNSNGENCLKIQGPTFSCPDGQVLKGIKTDGTPECVRGCTPQTGFFFGKQKRSVTTAVVIIRQDLLKGQGVQMMGGVSLAQLLLFTGYIQILVSHSAIIPKFPMGKTAFAQVILYG